MTQLTSKDLRRAATLQDKIQKLNTELARLMGNAAGSVVGTGKKRNLTPAGRARIAAAVRARWAREKAAKNK